MYWAKGSPVCHRVNTFTLTGNLEFPLDLTYMPFECGRKLIPKQKVGYVGIIAEASC